MPKVKVINCRDLIMPELFKTIRDIFPKGTLVRTPEGEIFRVIETAFFLEQGNQICVPLVPAKKTLGEIKTYSGDLDLSKYRLDVDYTWLMRQGVSILEFLGGNKNEI